MRPGVTVLLVDDDDAFRAAVGGELEQLGFGVTEAGSGAEAIARASALEPEVVLLDLDLPDVDGLRVLRAIREQSPGSEVVILSGRGSVDIAVRSVRTGASDFVTKPCSLADLELRILEALERRALRLRGGQPEAEPGSAHRLQTLEELERAHIERVLRATGGHRAEAARILGISERNLYRKIGEYRP